jgi:hypothetical protein
VAATTQRANGRQLPNQSDVAHSTCRSDGCSCYPFRGQTAVIVALSPGHPVRLRISLLGPARHRARLLCWVKFRVCISNSSKRHLFAASVFISYMLYHILILCYPFFQRCNFQTLNDPLSTELVNNQRITLLWRAGVRNNSPPTIGKNNLWLCPGHWCYSNTWNRKGYGRAHGRIRAAIWMCHEHHHSPDKPILPT